MSNHTQKDVLDWVRNTFGQKFLNDRERAFRFIEEALELVQSIGLSIADVAAIGNHVYDRPPGDYPDEMGGVMITLEALAEHLGVDLERQRCLEWERINSLPQSHFDAASARKQEADVCHVLRDDQI